MQNELLNNEIAIKIAGAFISILLLIISFFLKRLLIKLDNMNDTMSGIVRTTAVQGGECRLIHLNIDKTLDEHNLKIQQNTEHIIQIKQKINLL